MVANNAPLFLCEMLECVPFSVHLCGYELISEPKNNAVKISLLLVGKTDAGYVKTGIEDYEKRMRRYLPFEIKVIPDVKNARNMSASQQKEREGEAILAQLEGTDRLVLLDERGEEYTSKEFSAFLVREMLGGVKRLVFVIGGPYGFGDAVYARADAKISLSRMTFSHQLVRLVFMEQLYRGMTIWKGEPYHHE